MEQRVFLIRKYLTRSLKDVLVGEGPLAAHAREFGDEAGKEVGAVIGVEATHESCIAFLRSQPA